MKDNLSKENDKSVLSDLLSYFSSEHSFLAEELVREFCSLENILGQDPHILKEIPGITNTLADFLYYLPQFFCAADLSSKPEPCGLTSPKAFLPLLEKLFRYRMKEELFVLLLNKKFKLTNYLKCGTGVCDMTEMDLGKIKSCFRSAKNVHFAVLAHNHPGGTAIPSKEDTSAAAVIAEAAKLHSIGFIDSIVYTHTASFSFFLNGIIQNEPDAFYAAEADV